MPSPRGGSSFLLCLRMLGCCFFPLGEGWDEASMLGWGFYGGWYAPPATLSELLLLAGGHYVFSPLFFASVRGDKINTKSRVVDGGFALAWMVAPTIGKRVFLRAVSTIPTVMRCMTPSTTTVKKRPTAVQKVRLSPVQKQLLIEGLSNALPKGWELISAVFEMVGCSFFPLGKVGMGLP